MEKFHTTFPRISGNEKNARIVAKENQRKGKGDIYGKRKAEQEGMTIEEFIQFGCKCTG